MDVQRLRDLLSEATPEHASPVDPIPTGAPATLIFLAAVTINVSHGQAFAIGSAPPPPAPAIRPRRRAHR